MPSPRTREILQQLIGFDTTSVNSNLQLLDYIRSLLQQEGVDCQLVYDEQGQKANLYATIGPQDKPGVMLSGHTDTVPVSGQAWTLPPHQLTEQIQADGSSRWYGRGTTDMKGFIAVVLAAVPEMLAQPLHTPIHLAFSYDEEIGCIGVRRLIDTLKSLPVKPAMGIIGEPTRMKVVTAHKGKLAARVTVTGKECHSGMAPLGVNAINYAARLIVWLEQLARQKRLSGPFEEGYEIPYTTVHTGVVKGGQALNIVPNHCEFVFEFRNVAAESPRDLLAAFRAYAAEVEAEMRQQHADCAIAIDITSEYAGLATAEDEDVVAFVQQLTGEQDTATINFGTEGGLFSQVLGVPNVVCGPGSMDQGHKPDEYIETAELERCEAMLQRLIQRLSQVC
ncbi:acetylornithine deacetylase [Oceanobacter mangrovi]|uniref:acetylornithine deacetylase n=1 Tax=Oceanobacter mangrovi TaxID=2862510 RepID=UPI001C8E30D9|nr:acetylornithine deacetylase [Oceanobacter mangrovi]